MQVWGLKNSKKCEKIGFFEKNEEFKKKFRKTTCKNKLSSL